MKALIIEDERPTAERLCDMLRQLRPSIEIVDITTDITSSVKVISECQDLDIVFSDIKLDDGLSFSVFDRVHTNAMIVFTTAYDEHALKAFDYNCIDYLMKPVSRESLERALERCEQWKSHTDEESVRSAFKDYLECKTSYRKKILIEQGTSILIRNVEDISHIFTEKGDTRVYLKDGAWGTIEYSLNNLAESLPEDIFFRINRQAIVNIDAIDVVSHGPGRDYLVSMKKPFEDKSFQITASMKKNLLSAVVRS